MEGRALDIDEGERVIEYKLRPGEREKPVVSNPLYPRFMLPDWFFLWVYGILKWVGWIYSALNISSPISFLNAKEVGIIASGLVILILFLIPFIDRGPTARPTERRLKSAIGVMGVLLIFFMSLYGINEIISEATSMDIESTRNLLGMLAIGAPVALGAVTYVGLSRLRGGYEYQLNRCYQCEKCDQACPLAAIGEIENLNLVHNTYQNVTDDVWTCLTCGRCSAVCPQHFNYEEYILSLRQ
ncbi:MAG: 4Fe-4S dicluster domain-containing protein, partial [Candidatus Bathyarchaeia archaeon]